MRQEEPYIPPFIRRLMPNASEREIIEAAENLKSYLRVMYRIFREREEKERRLDSPHFDTHGRFAARGLEPPKQ